MGVNPKRIYIREKTTGGAVFYKMKDGSTQYDLTESQNLLRDMNRAIIKDTNGAKSGSSNRAIYWFLNAIETGQMLLPDNKTDLTDTVLNSKSRRLSKGSSIFTDFPGRMYAFRYRPKNIIDLPYFDRTPLVISLPRTRKMVENNLFFGINLHYLEPDFRSIIIERLLKISSRRFGEKPPPKGAGFFYIDYDIIKSLRFVFGMPCIRTYSIERIIGNPVLIGSNEWSNAVALPFENFVKAREKRVWVETRLKIREQIKTIGMMEQ
jgi:hypothetical protein